MNNPRPSCSARSLTAGPVANVSAYITRKELAAVAEISEDTLMRKPDLKPVRKAIEESRDKLCERPIRCHRASLRTRLSLYGHQQLAEKI